MSPPAVLSLVPFQTCHFLPTLETFLAFLFLLLGAAFLAFLVDLDLDLDFPLLFPPLRAIVVKICGVVGCVYDGVFIKF